ncbi:MAG: SAM-dependent methyltransferase [Acidimicrobiia bacterium]|nr:SAM-dependent methyltransferase [Acidimicrobiia bacterium]
MSSQWEAWRRNVNLDDYDARCRTMEAAGVSAHGEADLASRFGAQSVLDGGTGTGRVAIELARRGLDVVGVDVDPDMLALARSKAPELTWVQSDLATMDLGRQFDLAILAGNVLLFTPPESEPAVIAQLARHLRPDGHLLMGFQLLPGRITADQLDQWCHQAELEPVARWSTWEGEPFVDGSPYLVSVHRRRP